MRRAWCDPINADMPGGIPAFLLYAVSWATVARAVLVYVQKLPPTCGRCNRRFERRHLGEIVCACHSAH
jgi:hypothetical protein